MKGQVKICYFHTKIEQEQLYDKTGQKRRKFTHLLCLQIIVYNHEIWYSKKNRVYTNVYRFQSIKLIVNG